MVRLVIKWHSGLEKQDVALSVTTWHDHHIEPTRLIDRTPVRLMVGLMILQHTFGISDETVVSQWTQNPYWQYFCGYDFLQWEPPIDPSSLTRWRKRLGEDGLQKVLSATIKTAVTTKTVETKDFTKVIADTTVMEKNVSYPTDTKLLNKAREKLVKLCE